LLSERDPFAAARSDVKGPLRTATSYVSRSDVLDRVQALEEFEQGHDSPSSASGRIHPPAAYFVLRARDQLLAELNDADEALAADDSANSESFLRSLLAAFPDRLAKRRDSNSMKALMVGGRGVRLRPQCAVTDAELFLCVDVDAGLTEAEVRQASAVERSWLEPSQLRTAEELFFHPTQKSVVARRRIYWDDLVIEETSIPVSTSPEVTAVLADAAWKEWERVFPSADATLTNYLARVACLREWMPDLGLPAFDGERKQRLLNLIASDHRSFAELQKADWLGAFQSELTYPQRQAIERETPEKLAVPSGSHIALQYEPGRPPILAVKIQEVFGLAETPRIAGGRVRVLFHLLAPNMRPQQITDDLASFWKTGYLQVRKDLRARYPKHSWPEDPWNALPTSRPARRRPN
jgi:ATP-dependent helicase HrpB